MRGIENRMKVKQKKERVTEAKSGGNDGGSGGYNRAGERK